MRQAIFLSSVRADLLRILEYIAEESGSIAIGENFVAQLRGQCQKLAALNVKIGRARPELRPGIRSFPYKGYVIFFRYERVRFEVVNILEGHMDIDAFFRVE